MKFYEYVAWRLENKNLSYKYLFWKDKEKKIHKLEEYFDNNDFEYWTKELDDDSLIDFYNNLYKDFIKSKKTNPRIIDIPNKIKEWKENLNKIYYIWYVKRNWIILAWWIFSFMKNSWWKTILTLWYRAYKKEEKFVIWFWYFVEYLFFKLWFDLNIDIFSRWKDKNWYWFCGPSTFLPIHKLQLKFQPWLVKDEKYQNILELSSIENENDWLFFSDIDKEWKCTTVSLFTQKNEDLIKNEYSILWKRWFLVNIIKK